MSGVEQPKDAAAGASAAGRLRVSIVSYASDEAQLGTTLRTLLAACALPLRSGRLAGVDIVLVDNGPAPSERAKLERLIGAVAAATPSGATVRRAGAGANIGFGGGHNSTIAADASEFHLVLNPDVEVDADALAAALRFMDDHPDCGLLTPAIRGDSGAPQYLCKRYPSILDLLLRGFAPGWLRAVFDRRLAHYEMRDVIDDRVVWQPAIVSGCFMLVRTSLLARLGGFDPAYFLYFEDFDFSLRAGAASRIAYVPAVRVIHHGGHAARKGLRHILMFVRSAITFFNSHGWKWY